MNRIFKVIWSKTKHCYVVVSEYAKANTKAAHTSMRATAAALAAAAVLLAPVDYSTVWAAPATQEATVKDTSGTEQTVYTKDGTDNQIKEAEKYTYRKTAKEENERKAADAAIEQKMADQKTDKALHVTNNGKLIVGTNENQQVKDIAIRGALKSGSVSTGDITATGDITVKNGKVEAESVYDDTTKTGTYVKQNSTVGANLSALDKQITTDKTSTALHVSKDGNLIVGTKENQTVKDVKIRGQMTSGSVSTGNITSTGDVSVTGKVEAGAVYDSTTKTGNYIKQNITVGMNLSKLDTQVKSNADAITEEASARKQADTELGNRVTAVENKTAGLSYDEKTKTTTVNDKLAADSAKVKNSIEVGHNVNIGGAVNAGSINSRGNLNVDGNALVKGTLTSQSTINGKEIVSQTNITAKNKVVGMQGVVDNTLTDGTYVTAGNTVGQNINALDEQVKTNAETANQLQHSLAAEATAREDGDNAIRQAMTDQKTSTALHVSKDGNLIVGTKENQTVKDVKIRGQLTSGSISTGNITSTGDVSVAGKVEAEAVYDDTTKTGNYVVQTNSVGSNLSALDTQVKSNADAITAETVAREAKDTELNERITNEANAIHETTNQLQSDLNTEVKAREGADTALTNRIAAEETDRAEADTALQNAIDKEAADRKAADTTLQTNIDNEAAAREAADTALDSRTTALEAKTEAITYDKDSKTVMVDGKLTVTEGITDGTTQNGQYVKLDNYVGQNLNALDQGIQAETTARQAADKTLQDNIDAEAAARKDADEKLDNKITAEKKARVEADTRLTEAVNNGLSLSDENVLQKNNTTIDADGTVTTTKTDANEMILNKGKDNQITLNEKGIKVGTNSTVIDKDGVYTGGDTYNEAKAGLKSDGSIKGADGKFTVNSANGTVNVNDQITLNGATGVVKANGLNIGDGNMTVSNNGNIKTVGTLSAADGNFKVNSNGGVSAAGGKTTLASDGSIKAADGKFTVNSNGGVKAADGKITLSSDGSVKAADGKFTVNSNGAVKAADGKFTVDSNGAVSAANGNTTIDSNGNIKTVGTLSVADGSFKVDNTGKITSTGLDAGNGTIQTTGTVKAGDVQTGTLETTGDATIGGDLTVKGKLNVDEINMTKTGIVGDNNVTASTKVTAGEITGYKKATSTKDGSEKESAFDYDENGTSTWAKSTDADGNWNKSTMSVEGSGVTSKAIDSNKNSNLSTQTATQSQNKLTDVNQNTNTATKSAMESSSILANKDGLSSTFKQNVAEILNQVNKSNTEYAKVDQKADNITSEVTDGTNTTSTTQSTKDITNTAKQGTITNDASKIVNNASDAITNTAANDITNTSTNGNIANTAENGTISNNAKNLTNTASENITNTSTNGNISNIAANGTINNEAKNISNKAAEALTNDAKTITNTASESVTTQIGDGSVVKSVMNENGIANTAAGKTITNDAADITNMGTNSVTNQVGTNKVLVNKDKVETAYGDDTYTTWDASGIVSSTTGNMSTTVGGDQTNDIKGSQTNTIGGSQTTTVTGDSSLTAENINNTAKNKITNKALDVETEAASSIVNKVSNDYGSNTSTQTSSQTQEEMSQEDGKTASYLRGAAEEKSQLVNGDTKTTIDTIAGQTNTNITDGTNISNNLQKASQIASSVTDGTNTTVANQDAKSIASSITDGTNSNNISNTAAQSAQLIKASDTQYSSSTKTAGAFSDTLVSGDSIVNILKDADNGFVQSNVSKSDSSTSVKQTSTDITNTAKNGTITNDAKDIVNSAAENMTNTVGKDLTTTVGGNMKTTVTGNQVNTIGGDLSTTVTGDSGLNAKNISNTATEKLSNSAAEIENTATSSIKDIVGKTTITTNDSGTIFENTEHNTAVKEGSATNTVISGNTLTTGQATMDYANVLKDLGVRGNAAVDGNTTIGKEGADTTLTVNSKSTFKDTVKMEKTLEVDGTSTFNDKVTITKNGLDVTGGTTTDTLQVTSTSQFDGAATFKDIVTMEKDLSVGGNATVAGSVTAGSYKVGDATYIDANGINANNQKVTNVAAGDVSATSTDAVNGSQLYNTNQRVSTVETRVDGVENRVTSVENRVDKMDSRIDKVGANAAAMANLHPLEFDEDSKWNVAAAVGNYKGETAAAVGAFYRPNEDVMFNLSTTFGNDENMVGGGLSLRLGKGGNREKDKKLKAAIAENNDLRAKVDDLTARMDALLSVINPNMSKEFPDVPENHWAYEAVTRLAGNNIVEGYEDGKFHGERTMTRYEMAEIIYNALSKGAKAEKKLVEEFKPELQAMAAQKQAK